MCKYSPKVNDALMDDAIHILSFVPSGKPQISAMNGGSSREAFLIKMNGLKKEL